MHEDGSPWSGETRPSTVAMRTGVAQRDQIMGFQAPEGEAASGSRSTQCRRVTSAGP